MSSKLSVNAISISIVISEFNQKVIENLLKGAIDAFTHHGGIQSNLNIYRVPGAFEIPGTIQQIIKFHNPHAIVALGAVIKGETPHFDFISQSTTDAIMQLSINSKKPIGNGIITTLNKKQAKFRSLTKGQEAAGAVLSVLDNF